MSASSWHMMKYSGTSKSKWTFEVPSSSCTSASASSFSLTAHPISTLPTLHASPFRRHCLNPRLSAATSDRADQPALVRGPLHSTKRTCWAPTQLALWCVRERQGSSSPQSLSHLSVPSSVFSRNVRKTRAAAWKPCDDQESACTQDRRHHLSGGIKRQGLETWLAGLARQ